MAGLTDIGKTIYPDFFDEDKHRKMYMISSKATVIIT